MSNRRASRRLAIDRNRFSPSRIATNLAWLAACVFATVLVIVKVAHADDATVGQQSSSETPSNLTVVDVVRVQPASSVQEIRRFSGLIEAKRNSSLSFERIGRITEISVDEGDTVGQGDVLAILDTAKLDAERAKLVAEKAVLRAELAELLAGPRPEKIAAAKARLERSEALLDQAQRNLLRRQSLVEDNLVSAELFENARSQADSVAAEARSLQQELLELENGSRSEKILAKRAQIESVDASIKVVDVDLENSQIKAPFAGTIVARVIDEGTIVSPGEELLDLAETTSLRGRFGIPNDSVQNVSVGQSVRIEVGGQILDAKVDALVSRVTQATRTQTVLVSFEDAETLVYDGQVARLLLQETIRAEGYQLPRSALTRGTRGLWNCYVAEGENAEYRTVQRRIVDVIRTSGDKVIVKGNLSPGNIVVASATHRVTANQRVRIRDVKETNAGLGVSQDDAPNRDAPSGSDQDGTSNAL